MKEPGASTEPIWRVRIESEWNHADDGLDVWVIQEEFDTDEKWLGMRVLGGDGHWREWLTVEGSVLGSPTQTLPGIVPRLPTVMPVIAHTPPWPPIWSTTLPPPSGTTGGVIEALKKAEESLAREYAERATREFIHGPGPAR